MIKITESILRDTIKKVLREEANNSITNSLLTDPNNVVVWRVFHHETENSIFQNGYSSEYFGDGEGSYHGVGVYSFYKPYGAQKRCGGEKIGDKIMKCVLVNGFKDFLILDAPIALKYYNSDDIRVQLKYLYDGNNDLMNAIANKYRQEKGDFKLHFNATTGYLSRALYETFKDKLRAGKTRGVVYNGGKDPNACLTFNPREIIPIAVTNEKVVHGGDFSGWQYKLTKELYDKNQKVLDFYSYGESLKSKGLIQDYSKVPPVNDCILVILPNGRKTMYNVLENKFISKYGFDKCYGWEERKKENSEAVSYVLPIIPKKGSGIFYLRKEKNGKYYFYSKYKDFAYKMSIEKYDSTKEMVAENKTFSSIYGTGDDWMDVYHRTDSNSAKGIFKGGFTKEYTGRNANVAGVGIYITFSPEDSNRNTRSFGECMLHCKLKDGLNGFLIPSGTIIKGRIFNESIKDQFSRLVYPQFKDELLQKYNNYFDSNSAQLIYKALCANNDLGKINLRGIIYRYGSCFAGVAIDWKSVIPYEYSMNDGRTWNVGIDSEKANFMKEHGDTKFALNKYIASGVIKDTFGNQNGDISANQQYVYGYIRVILAKNNKVSFYSAKDDKIISYKGFDAGVCAEKINFDGVNSIVIPVKDGNTEYYIYKEDDGTYSLYKEEDRFKPFKFNGEIMNNELYDKLYNA